MCEQAGGRLSALHAPLHLVGRLLERPQRREPAQEGRLHLLPLLHRTAGEAVTRQGDMFTSFRTRVGCPPFGRLRSLASPISEVVADSMALGSPERLEVMLRDRGYLNALERTVKHYVECQLPVCCPPFNLSLMLPALLASNQDTKSFHFESMSAKSSYVQIGNLNRISCMWCLHHGYVIWDSHR